MTDHGIRIRGRERSITVWEAWRGGTPPNLRLDYNPTGEVACHECSRWTHRRRTEETCWTCNQSGALEFDADDFLDVLAVLGDVEALELFGTLPANRYRQDIVGPVPVGDWLREVLTCLEYLPRLPGKPIRCPQFWPGAQLSAHGLCPECGGSGVVPSYYRAEEWLMTIAAEAVARAAFPRWLNDEKDGPPAELRAYRLRDCPLRPGVTQIVFTSNKREVIHLDSAPWGHLHHRPLEELDACRAWTRDPSPEKFDAWGAATAAATNAPEWIPCTQNADSHAGHTIPATGAYLSEDEIREIVCQSIKEVLTWTLA